MFHFFKITALQSNPNGWEAYYRRIQLYDHATHLLKLKVTAKQPHGRNVLTDNREQMYRTVMNPGKEGDWIMFQSEVGLNLTRIVVQQFGNDGNHISRAKLQGSADGQHWYSLHTFQKMKILQDVKLDKFQKQVKGKYVKKEELRFQKLTDYQKRIESSPNVLLFRGKNMCLVIDQEAKIDLHHGQEPVFIIISYIEELQKKYQQITNYTPVHSGFERPSLLEIAFLPTAAGLAAHGHYYAAIGPFFFQFTYDKVVKGERMLHQIFFYELFRNYCDPRNTIQGLGYDSGEGTHWLTQGFVNIVGCLYAAELDMNYFYDGKDRDGFRKFMQDQLDEHIKRNLKWEDCLGTKSLIPWKQRSSIDNIWSGLFSRLFTVMGPKYLYDLFRLATKFHGQLMSLKPDGKKITVGLTGLISRCENGGKGVQVLRKLNWPVQQGIQWGKSL